MKEARSFDCVGIKYLLAAEDMKRAVSFYTRVFDLDVWSQSDWWSELKWRDATVALHGGGTGTFQRTGLSFTVDDIEAACRSATKAGGQIRSGPEDRGDEGILLAEIVDTEGNGIMISQDK